MKSSCRLPVVSNYLADRSPHGLATPCTLPVCTSGFTALAAVCHEFTSSGGLLVQASEYSRGDCRDFRLLPARIFICCGAVSVSAQRFFSVQYMVEESRINLRRPKIRVTQDPREERKIGLDSPDKIFAKRAGQFADRLIASAAVAAEFRQ